jgi:hypothetical protein
MLYCNRVDFNGAEITDTQEIAEAFKVPMQRNFTERFLDCIAKIL